jgi:hypothetical protein
MAVLINTLLPVLSPFGTAPLKVLIAAQAVLRFQAHLVIHSSVGGSIKRAEMLEPDKRHQAALGGCDNAVAFVLYPARKPFDIGVRSQSFKRVVLAFQILDIDRGVDVSVARAAQ